MVAFTVPIRFRLLDVRVIRPPLEYTLDPESEEQIPISELRLRGVRPLIVTLPLPVVETLLEVLR